MLRFLSVPYAGNKPCFVVVEPQFNPWHDVRKRHPWIPFVLSCATVIYAYRAVREDVRQTFPGGHDKVGGNDASVRNTAEDVIELNEVVVRERARTQIAEPPKPHVIGQGQLPERVALPE
jgi:hypothetical protein